MFFKVVSNDELNTWLGVLSLTRKKINVLGKKDKKKTHHKKHKKYELLEIKTYF